MAHGWFPPPTRPRDVEGGLKARSRRGAIGESWWSERFVTVLEEIGLGNRLQRGRNYARRGQVISLDVAPGSVTAGVQGSRARPYRVRIGLPAFGKAEWARIEAALAGDAWYAAQLLAGTMPEDIENVFAANDLALFPASARELSMDCSCPDSAVPCKHVAAAFYLLAEAFDEDPFRVLAWRGREREDLLANLKALRSAGPPAADTADHVGRPLADCLDTFFRPQAATPPAAPPATSAPPEGPGARGTSALVDQLPPVGILVRGQPIVDLLRPAYAALKPGAESDSDPGAD